tara:strand:+ start:6142 stop:6912 length:771 start_codon:yes stop_codon:yes gene_type:complete
MVSCFLQGGLGNQLFQIAAAYAAAKRNNASYGFIDGQHHLPLQGNDVGTYKTNILRKVPFVAKESFGNPQMYPEPGHQYTPLPETDNLFLMGYFQSEKYFKDCKEDIRDLFRIPEEIESIILEQYPFLVDEKVVSVHVRRGDYLNSPNIHPTVQAEYYQNALDSLEDKDKVIVFSDDLVWCRETFGEGYYYSAFEEDYLDLYTMSKCHHHILANSTFSWWGAWLSETSGRIIAPKAWFGPNWPNSADVIPESWERL